MTEPKPQRILVEAGAGCGKTTSIVKHFEKALSSKKNGGEGFLAEEILLLTFTDAAAREMQQRIKRDCPELDFKDAYIGTFHAYCFRLLNSSSHQATLNGEIFSENELSILLKKDFLSGLSQNPQLEELLSYLSLKEIMELALYGSDNPQSLNEAFDHLEKTWALVRDQLLLKLNSLDSENLSPTDWPLVALEMLESKNPFLKVTFSTKKILKDIAQKNPAVLEKVKQLRDLNKQGIYTALLESFEKEKQILLFLMEEIQKIRSALPQKMTFSEVEKRTLLALENKLVPPKNLKLIIVDEFQDTSPEQWKIIEHLSHEQTHWYLVGDPKQSIYAFRRADIKLYKKLKEKIEVKELSTNYRSAPEVLACTNTLQEKMFCDALDPEAQSLKSGKEVKALVLPIKIHQSPLKNWPLTLECIKERDLQETGLKHAVLFREWSKLYEFSAYLNQEQVAYTIEGSENHLEHYLTQGFLNFLTAILKEETPDRLDLFPLRDISLKSESLSFYKKIPDVLSLFYEFSYGIHIDRWPEAKLWASSMERVLRDTQNKGFNEWGDIYALLSQSLVDSPKLNLPHNPHTRGPKISLLTIHASKGLEFDCVYLPDPRERISSRGSFEEDEIPFKYNVTPQQKSKSLYFELRKVEREFRNEAEQKRLFYVAITRAIKSIDFFIPPEKVSKEKSSEEKWWAIWREEKELNRFKWSELIQKLLYEESLKKSLDYMEHSADSSEEEIEEPLSYLLPLSKKDSLLREVTLENPLKDLKIEELLKLSPLNESQLWGTQLHSVLELWDGCSNPETLVEAFEEKDKHEVLAALKALRECSDLDFYWKLLAQKSAKDVLILREEQVLDIQADKEKLYVIDVLLLEKDKATIIDWKTSSSEEYLRSPARRDVINLQLENYASTLKNHVSEVRNLPIGIVRKAPLEYLVFSLNK